MHIAIMNKKITQASFQTVTPRKVIMTYANNRGDTTSYERGAYGALLRNHGETAVLFSETSKDGHFNPCSHSKESYDALPLSSVAPEYMEARYYTTGPTGLKYCRIYNLYQNTHHLRYAAFKSAVNAVTTDVKNIPWGSLSAQALQTMLPTLHAKTNLVNFILELKDFKWVMKGSATRILQRWRGQRGLFERDWNPGRSTAKTLANKYLAYSFAWRPLISDVYALWKQATSLNEKVSRLIREASTVRQSYWGTTVPGTSLPLVSSNYIDGPTGGWVGGFTGKTQTKITTSDSAGVRYHATVRYRYNVPADLLAASGQFRAALDVLGVGLNPAILWNAIPFTFIIDWLVDVSTWLEQFRVDNVQLTTEILDFCHSGKSSRQVRMAIAGEMEDNGTRSYMSPVTTDTCTKSYYERRVGDPGFYQAIRTSGLNGREFSLAGALAISRRK